MRNDYAELVTGGTPQTQPIPSREAEMVKNDAGGYVFKIEAEEQIRRFLILGSDSPTYYASARKMTIENSQCIIEYANHEPEKCARIIHDVSVSGAAFKNDPAIFSLAVMAEMSTPSARKEAFKVLNAVCRTGSQFMLFNSYMKTLGAKSNRSYRNAIKGWYQDKKAYDLAYQVLKYRNRYGFTHQDLINLGHPTSDDDGVKRVLHYVMNGELKEGWNNNTLAVFDEIKRAKNEREVVKLIKDNDFVSWEFVPSQWLGTKNVWNALMYNMPYTALIRNLGQLTSKGLLEHNSNGTKHVLNKLSDTESLKRARVHPFSILVAERIYRQGRGQMGSKEWKPTSTISSALDDAFYAAFDYVQPSGKSFMFGIDASGSTAIQVSDRIPMSVAEAEAVMSMVAARSEENSLTEAYANGRRLNVNIDRTDSLGSAARKIRKVNTGTTDLAAPMIDALNDNLDIDCFVIMTDNQTWFGNQMHPVEALQHYRARMDKPYTRMIVAAFTATDFSIADPIDPLNLDIVGLDTGVPRLITQFAKGE